MCQVSVLPPCCLPAVIAGGTEQRAGWHRSQLCCGVWFVHLYSPVLLLGCLQEPEEAYDRITELCKRLFKVSC
jgi:hypothetical protein